MRERFAFCGQTAARTGLTLLLVASALLASGGCERAHSQAAPVARDSWAHGVGYVEPAGEVRRLAFSRPGVIATCAARVGGRVAAGHVLMTLRAEAERAALAEAEAALMLAQAELAQVRAGVNAPQIAAVRAAQAAAEADAVHARQELVRQRQLFERRASSQAEFELADTARRRAEAIAAQRNAELSHLSEYVRDTDVAVAAARVQLAAARLERARREVSETRLLAPADGVVLECLRREGEAAHPGDGAAAVVFADLSRLVVRAEIDETHALQLRAGQDAVISGPALGGRELNGRVTLVKPVMGRKTVFAQTATERKDLDVVQVLIALPEGVAWPIGLEVDVRVMLPPGGHRHGGEHAAR